MNIAISMKSIFLIGAILVISSSGVYFFKMTLGDGLYYAVKLDTNEIYFGQQSGLLGSSITLTDVYYFGSDTPLASEKDVDRALIKLGSEVHGPEDKMYIRKEHIVFVEGLSESSSVLEAIREYKKK